jgi:hypothetical protein
MDYPWYEELSPALVEIGVAMVGGDHDRVGECLRGAAHTKAWSPVGSTRPGKWLQTKGAEAFRPGALWGAGFVVSGYALALSLEFPPPGPSRQLVASLGERLLHDRAFLVAVNDIGRALAHDPGAEYVSELDQFLLVMGAATPSGHEEPESMAFRAGAIWAARDIALSYDEETAMLDRLRARHHLGEPLRKQVVDLLSRAKSLSAGEIRERCGPRYCPADVSEALEGLFAADPPQVEMDPESGGDGQIRFVLSESALERLARI